MDEVELGRGEANYYTSMKSHLSLALEQLHVAYSGLYSSFHQCGLGNKEHIIIV